MEGTARREIGDVKDTVRDNQAKRCVTSDFFMKELCLCHCLGFFKSLGFDFRATCIVYSVQSIFLFFKREVARIIIAGIW